MLLTAGFVGTACAGDVIAERQADCASRSDHCASKVASGMLYLDTSNLPSVLGDNDRLVLCATPVDGTCDSSRIDLQFEGGPLTADIDPGIADEAGWKIGFSDLSVTWVDPPGTLRLTGRLRHLDFVFDPNDERSIALDLN